MIFLTTSFVRVTTISILLSLAGYHKVNAQNERLQLLPDKDTCIFGAVCGFQAIILDSKFEKIEEVSLSVQSKVTDDLVKANFPNQDSNRFRIEYRSISKLPSDGILIHRKFHVKLKYRTKKGKVKKLKNKQDLYIQMPEVLFTKEKSGPYYTNCMNPVRIEVKGVGSEANLQFSLDSGKVIQKPNSNYFMLNPETKKSLLKVMVDSVVLKIIEIEAIVPPQPIIETWIMKRAFDLSKGRTYCPRTVEFKAIPDPKFQASYSNETRYKFIGVKIYLVRNGVVLDSTKSRVRRNFDDNLGSDRGIESVADLGRLKGKSQGGDVIKFVVYRLVRIDISGKSIVDRNFKEVEINCRIRK